MERAEIGRIAGFLSDVHRGIRQRAGSSISHSELLTVQAQARKLCQVIDSLDKEISQDHKPKELLSAWLQKAHECRRMLLDQAADDLDFARLIAELEKYD